MLAIVLTSQAMAQAIPSNVPKDGLIGWWPFNGNANDESGNGNHGTVNGATLTSDRNGKENSAYSFDGLDNMISTNMSSSSKTLSISVWVKVEKDKFSYPLGFGDNEQIGGYGLGFSSVTGECQLKEHSFFVYDGYEKCQNIIQTESVNEINKWENITFILQNNSISLYKNNKFQGTNDNFLLTGINLLQFGRRNDNFWSFGGQIDDIAIYNRALSEQEIKQLYDGCPREKATLNPTNGVVLKNSNPITLSATPSGGVFKGKAILNGDFIPKNATLGSNSVDYRFVNSQGCKDSTQFKVVVYDTLGIVCSSTDTLKIKVQLTTGIKAGQMTAMNVYPNPTSDVLIIEASDLNALKNYTYRIVNLEGKEVYKYFVTSVKTEISLKTLGSKGVYVLHILDEKGTSIENKKIVLE